MEVIVWSSIIVIFSYGLHKANADIPSIECGGSRAQNVGKFATDPEEECIYYRCTFKGWLQNTCLQFAIPKTYRKRYSQTPTRLNPCTNARKKVCQEYSSIVERKTGKVRVKATPNPLPECVLMDEFCRATEQCCKGLKCFMQKCTPEEDFACARLGEGCNGRHKTGQGCCAQDPEDATISYLLQCDSTQTCCGQITQVCVKDEDCCTGVCENGACADVTCEYPQAEDHCGYNIQRSAENKKGRFNVGEKVYFEPDSCYTLDTSDGVSQNFVTCMPGGTVSPSVPTCKVKECTNLPAPENGSRSPMVGGADLCDSAISFECDEGYQLTGPSEIECTEDGWNQEAPECLLPESPVEEVCSKVKGSCGDDLSPECCVGFTCSFDKICCVEEGGCSSDDECCRGLSCHENKCVPSTRIECDKPLDIVFSVDTSCSVADTDKTHIRTFMTETVRAFNIDKNTQDGILVGALTFNQGYQHVAYLQDGADNSSQLLDKIETMSLTPNGCKTNTFTALKKVESEYFSPENGDRPGVSNVAIVLTDGKTVPSGKASQTLQFAELLRESGATVLTIGLPQSDGSIVGEEEWLGIAGSEDLVFKSNFKHLRKMLIRVGGKLCGESNVFVTKIEEPEENNTLEG
ncbi:unnamed protein product [Owenia fusiformis]|uniref:Uncharacterized protein n=1 Tax=Owenia fusiformis TaxID=6347 RepID=A0A8J1UDP6_OWEFU|nr:unnamed protein product [Owenia fusiformis]